MKSVDGELGLIYLTWGSCRQLQILKPRRKRLHVDIYVYLTEQLAKSLSCKTNIINNVLQTDWFCIEMVIGELISGETEDSID